MEILIQTLLKILSSDWLKDVMKLLPIFLTGLLLLLIVPSPSFAQETPEQKAKKYGITFPIKELGGCINFQACKQYCADPARKDACIVYAQAKGFYKEKVSQTQAERVEVAKPDLGCDSVASCQIFCEKPANHARCTSFAQKHGLSYPQATSYSESDAGLLQKAKEQLDCDSIDSCYMLCEQEGNYEKCAGIAQQNISEEDRTMFEKHRSQFKESLGCDSIPTCMAFCMNPLNMPKCMEFGQKQGFDSTQTTYETESGEIWCPKAAREGETCTWDSNSCTCWNPNECRKWTGCTWTGSTCECSNSYVEGSAPEPGEIWCPKAGEYCKWDGTSCNCSEPGEVWCPRQPDCRWTGTECACAGSTSVPAVSAEEPGEVWCPRNPGCQWTGTTCECTSDTSVQPTSPAQVQGASAEPGLLEKALLFINRILPK